MTSPETDENGLVQPESLSDATIEAMRNAAIGHGRGDVADSLDEILKARASPELYRHSRRRTK